MATLKTLALRLRKIAKEEAILSSALASAYAEILIVRLTEVTPVDTSKAVSNWQVSFEASSTVEREAYFPGSKKSTMSQSVNAARNAAILVLKKRKRHQTIYVSNAASYILDLNDGSSAQAPSNFIEQAIYSCEMDLPRLLRNIKNGRKS